MFVIDTKQIKRIIERSKRYSNVSFDMLNIEYGYGDMNTFINVCILDNAVSVKVKDADNKSVCEVTINQAGGVTFSNHIFDYIDPVNELERHQENLINEIKKPLDYKLNKLYKLIFRRIVSKGLYQDHTDKYNVYLIADTVTQNKNDLTIKVNSHHRFEFKHPMSGLVLGTVDWWYDKGNHKGMYHGDEQTSKNINDIIALLME